MKPIAFLCAFFVSCAAFAQGPEIVETTRSGISIGVINNKYGLFDKTQKTILEAKYENIEHAGEGYFIAILNGKFGLYDAKGAELLKPEYKQIFVENTDKPVIFAEENGVTRAYIHKKIKGPLFCVSAGNPFYQVCQEEVTVAEYLGYLMNTTGSNPAEYRESAMLPDTNHMALNNKYIFRKLLNVTEEQAMDQKKYWGWYRGKYNYFDKILLPKSILNDKKLVGYLDLPITGVTMKQAQAFLDWYSGYMSEYSNGHYQYKLRLPTPEEWRNFAESGLRAEDKGDLLLDSMNAKKCMLYNTIPDKTVCSNYQEKEKRFGDNVAIVLGYNPDMNGVYNIFGNVAEMTSQEGIAKGGSFKHYASQCRTDKVQTYKGPQEWLGFRWVVEYVQ
ncbi:MAG TPA: SUMF1/EgtB/PvdO family nonheme iron enzyme [Flavobacteriales bacterium]|nr:SUMF1/EgtB/PvdO family nonheme iron enzyme [Flavobacteriales bacterium]